MVRHCSDCGAPPTPEEPDAITLRNERFDTVAVVGGWVRRDGGDLAILATEAPRLTALAWGGEVREVVNVAVAGYRWGRASASRSRRASSRACSRTTPGRRNWRPVGPGEAAGAPSRRSPSWAPRSPPSRASPRRVRRPLHSGR